MGLPRSRRLTQSQRYSEVYRQGRSWSVRWVALKALPNGLARSRIGVAAGRALGSAVVRNRAKRRLRAAVRNEPLKSGWDVILVARGGMAEVPFGALKGAVGQVLARAGLLCPQEPSP